MSSPKASLHLLYVHSEQQPRYETIQVQAEKEAAKIGSVISAAFLVKPLSLQQGGFRCTLYVPNYPPVVSEVFPKKKEAEQDAARKALGQMGKSFTCDNSASKDLTSEEKVAALVERLGAIFTEKVVMSCQPLKEHFKAAMLRKDGRTGAVPAAALAVLDNKISSLCKLLNASSESDPLFAVAMVWEAAKRSPLVDCEDDYLIKSKDTFSPQFQAEFLSADIQDEACRKFKAVYIPSSEDVMVTGIEIVLEPRGYYLNALSEKLGIKEGSRIMMSRAIPRAPHDTRLYSVIPDMQLHSKPFGLLDGVNVLENHGLQRNKRASDLLGYAVYGDAILASVGSTWKSEGKLVCADVSPSCYYRLLLGRTPEGNYKLSRDAVLISKLPCSFSTRAQWRGALPRSLLIDFCHQHRLADPEFSLFSAKALSGLTFVDNKKVAGNNSNKCWAKVVYEGNAIEFESEHHYRNRNDALQSAALRALLFFSKKVDILTKYPRSKFIGRGQLMEATNLDLKETHLSASSASANGVHIADDQGVKGSNRAQDDLNKTMVSGSMVLISCDVWLVGCDVDVKLESHEEFEFEFGVGGIITELETMVSGMQVGGCEHLLLPVPNLESVLSTHHDAIHDFQNSDIGLCSLKYVVKMLKSLEPPEDRMESALFSPPLSKQRNEFAVKKIKEIHAKSLVDFGCGSGSLLDAVVEHLTNLEYIAGVDISLKSLLRAAKSLNTKLVAHGGESSKISGKKVKRVVLYEGSLAETDPRLCGFDVATCIEVVEHMDPEPLLKAGDIILGTYRPNTLILSTPNIEYNVLLQKITVDAKTNAGECQKKIPSGISMDNIISSEDATNVDMKSGSPMHNGHALHPCISTNASLSITLSDDESNVQPIKLRNDDHRFEWTRAEFQEWANHLASQFGYRVEYTGVGGSMEDPGFASQIAIFTRNSDSGNTSEHCITQEGLQAGHTPQDSYTSPCYREVWKYDEGGLS